MVNRSLAFTTSSTDPEGQSIQYRYDWGEAFSGWGAAATEACLGCSRAVLRQSPGPRRARPAVRRGRPARRSASPADRDGDGIADGEDLDNDNDGMPDAWEIAHGLDPFVNDAAGDLDGDGISNRPSISAGRTRAFPRPTSRRWPPAR